MCKQAVRDREQSEFVDLLCKTVKLQLVFDQTEVCENIGQHVQKRQQSVHFAEVIFVKDLLFQVLDQLAGFFEEVGLLLVGQRLESLHDGLVVEEAADVFDERV